VWRWSTTGPITAREIDVMGAFFWQPIPYLMQAASVVVLRGRSGSHAR
jgi:hypothetical protein